MANITNTTESAGSNLMVRALREAFYAGIVALGLFVLYVGLKTDQNILNELVLVQRWGLLATFVAIAMVGRFLAVAYVRPWFETRRAAKAAAPAAEREAGFVARNFGLLAVAALVVYPILMVALFGFQGSLKWVDNFGIQILIYVLLAWGLNIVVGLAGLLDLGYVAFYAVGAYSYALLSSYLGLSFWLLLPMAGILAALWGTILGFPVLRLKGDYLAIVTLAFGEIIRLVLINWTEVTKGTFGISGIAKASVFGIWSFDVSATNNFAKAFGLPMSSAYYKIFLFYLALALCMLAAFVTIRLRRMPIGRAWEALREDEIACRSLGINTVTTKLTAFATGAMFGGIAGSFFAVRQGFVSPESFVFLESAIILAIVVLGGMGSLVGIAVAATLMIGGTELLREMDFLKRIFGPDFTPELYRMLIFGLAMIIVMVWKPRGFVGSREPTAFLKERKSVSGSFTKEGHG
ncbi:high-affinity branched-chain amino acid ABC transporter permease LivM [Pararhizobium sp. YC-54]|uniref:high-affinity branched-chain amino acid ABC transporter permease LivM n=1 Tax=Pararhizobium sp. YC-54 TaxID=2986920 RepID=UPI0021F77A57|nr:high-affinity branched-chain amino acid ABC transporter permease LivM [Pararhizobium sp. YC-54]MCW0000853.1 high-affinity branched-chain amino acid ABC transporter permease LivM [Pararhizobium sp. YC-54]